LLTAPPGGTAPRPAVGPGPAVDDGFGGRLETVPDATPTGDEPPTERTRLRRLPEQGSHRREDLLAVLDAGFVCHLGIEVDGGPMVVPTTYGRSGGTLFLHGSAASRSLRTARRPTPVCVAVTLVDGVVLARSVFNHSVNYRCAMVFGVPEVVTDAAEKLAGLRAISDHVAPGQWEYARFPSDKELAATTVLRLGLDEASVKVSEGPPDDGLGPDGDLDVWAGEIPLRTVRLDPVADPVLRAGIDLPRHLRDGGTGPGAIPWRQLDVDRR
jgi:nitroimidazol reductase NimA-like FMN-containing flavoprotein (pyridoxamine 5'-phosphate oxidase superfamily)